VARVTLAVAEPGSGRAVGLPSSGPLLHWAHAPPVRTALSPLRGVCLSPGGSDRHSGEDGCDQPRSAHRAQPSPVAPAAGGTAGGVRRRGLDPLDAARTAYDAREYDRALSCAAEASARRPDEPDAHSERGAALSALGQLRGGEARLRPGAGARPRAPRLAARRGAPLRSEPPQHRTTTSSRSSTPSGDASWRARR
jgi:hypothetical protein